MTKETERKMLDYAEHHFNERYFLLYVAKRESGQTLKRDHRNRMRQFMYSQLKIPKELQKSDHQRGIYYSCFYENTREFLRGEIEQDQLIRNNNDGSVETLTQLWKDKYAAKRINNLMNAERQNLTETLFYDDIVSMSCRKMNIIDMIPVTAKKQVKVDRDTYREFTEAVDRLASQGVELPHSVEFLRETDEFKIELLDANNIDLEHLDTLL